MKDLFNADSAFGVALRRLSSRSHNDVGELVAPQSPLDVEVREDQATRVLGPHLPQFLDHPVHRLFPGDLLPPRVHADPLLRVRPLQRRGDAGGVVDVDGADEALRADVPARVGCVRIALDLHDPAVHPTDLDRAGVVAAGARGGHPHVPTLDDAFLS